MLCHSRAALKCDQRRHSFANVLRTLEPQHRRIAKWFGRPSMRTNWLLIVPLVTFGSICEAPAQVADLAGVLPGDRWVYEVTDEVTGDLKGTTTIVVLDVSEKEINTRWSARGAAGARQVAFDRNWSKIDDAVWKFTPSDGSGIKLPLRI